MRCIIVEDEEMSRLHLQRLCQKVDLLEVVQVFDNALAAYNFLETEAVDVAFLDVEMPDFSGIELVRQLPKPPIIVFTTSKKEYAAQAFEFIEHVADYMLKPVTLPRLLKAVKRLQAARESSSTQGQPTVPHAAPRQPDSLVTESVSDNYIFVKSERKYVRIDLDDLLYVETVGDYSIFHTEVGRYTVHATLKSICERLPEPRFQKVHRSYLVNLSKIKDIEDNNLLIDDRIIPVSRTQRAELMERIMPL
ncbi:MAG: DNA-binding response regulator [Bacteroidetes bacterium]|nr:MAG: DNA-binding response regulator [Bacteroidota bacterium]